MAQVTNSEYQNASNAMNDRYTSDSLQSYTNAYNDYMSQGMSSSEAANKARGLLVENTPTTNTSTPSTPTTPSSTSSNTYQNQGTGNYVFNPTTGYYENQTDTTKNTTNQNLTAPQNQTQTQGSTVSENTQSGALKPLSQEYYNQTNDNALNTIRNNLNNYRQTNPEYFTDYDSFKRNFSYDSRNDEQKNLLDEWYKGYTQQLQLSSVPTTDLYTQYKDGQISATELEGLRISNPEKYAELMNQINKGNIVSAYDDDKGADTTGMSLQDMAYNMASEIFTKFMNGDTGSEASNIFREYENKMNDPEMLGLSDKTTELQEQMENIQSDLDAIKKSVEEEYAGTGASRSKINAIISDRSYELQLQLRTLNSEYNKYATQYNNRMQQYQNEFSMQLQEYQINQQERQQQMSELGFALDLMNFETNDQKAEREWNYRVKQQEYANGNINSKDYQTRYKAALKSVQNLLAQYPGIPTQRSAEQMADDILKAIDGGSNLGAELTKINKFMQQKPEYRYMYNQTFKPATSSGFGTSMSIGGTDYVEYNGKLYTADEFNKQFGGAAGPTQTTNGGVSYDPVNPYKLQGALADYMNANKSGSNGGQCGKFVNDYLQTLGLDRLYGNSIASKTNTINVDAKDINNLSVGSVAVFDYSNVKSVSDNAKKYGHVGIVTEIDYQRGRVKLLESNLKGDEKVVSTRWVDINSPVLKGYFDPSKGAVVTGGETTTVTNNLSDQDKQKAEAMLKQIKSGAITNTEMSSARDWLIQNGYAKEFNEALDKGLSVSLTDTQLKRKDVADNRFFNNDIVKDFETASVQINNLINSLNANNGVGDLAGIFQFMKVLDPSSVVREGEFKNAAKSAGYSNPAALRQNYVKHGWDGTWLTEAQRGNFSKLAKELIKGQAEMYNLKYNALKKEYQDAGIDVSAMPENFADYVLKKLDGSYSSGYNFNIQNTDWYNLYANTAGGMGSTVQLSGGYTVNWN